ncbi:thioredoxin domain-containing protein [Streptomyces syringium]|uniref:thioredoxin domain-containing protein n=1 Tax=Streptomyces syringium TaxID=76729 RepID=UPI0034474A1A
MSNRNNQQNKQAARERLRAERERQAKKDKTRRQLVVAGSIVVVLAIAGGIGYAVTNMTNGSKNNKVSAKAWKAASDKTDYKQPANTTGDKGTTIVIGKKDAKNTLEIFEDMRCPICADFEATTGDTILKDIKDGKYKAQFTMGAFLDDNPQIAGSGSRNALSALGAALNVGPDVFLEYKKALFDKKNHPQETDDAYSDDAKLIEIAQSVKELKGNKDFDAAVEKGTYDKWALAVADNFKKAKDVTGTPTFKLNGEKLTGAGGGAPGSPQEFTSLVDAVLKK